MNESSNWITWYCIAITFIQASFKYNIRHITHAASFNPIGFSITSTQNVSESNHVKAKIWGSPRMLNSYTGESPSSIVFPLGAFTDKAATCNSFILFALNFFWTSTKLPLAWWSRIAASSSFNSRKKSTVVFHSWCSTVPESIKTRWLSWMRIHIAQHILIMVYISWY